MLPAPGDLVGGKYRVVRLIGEGGMGLVYEARHEHLGSQVALKFLHPDLAERPGLVARFLQEARVSASIKSPHVTHVMDVDQTQDGAAYLVMELLEGESLEARLSRGAPLPVLEAVDIAGQILAALEAAHARGVVHRDLKPDNVWLAPASGGSHVKLLDFGIAKLKSSSEFQQVNTRPGSMMGTPQYMAPEQAISADQVDPRADLYSLGVILYEMLSGKRPVDGEDGSEILERLVRGEVHPLATRSAGIPSGLCSLVDRLVAPDPAARPPSAAAARAELARFGGGSLHDGGRPSVPDTVPPDDRGVPPFVTAVHAAAVAPVRTDSMPRMSELAFAPTAVATGAPERARARGSKTWIVWTAVALALVTGASVWLYSNQSIFDDTAPPPLPGPAPSALSPAAPLDNPVEDTLPPKETRTRASRPAQPREAPDVTPPAVVNVPPLSFPSLPAFTIPSGVIPIPSGIPIPSALPPFFRELPGVTPGPAPSPTPSASPAR